MSRSINKVILVGNVGNDPEIRTIASGVKVAKVSLATNRVWNDRNGQKQEKTEWHRVTFWDKMAELVEQYVNKGDRLYVEGSLEYSDNGKQGDERRFFTDIRAREMVMLGGPSGRGGEGRSSSSRNEPARQPAMAGAPSGALEDDDDLPF
jgi:single-strand DNA-binding protein